MSHLLQMRGLKHCRLSYCTSDCRVASFTDAWIETAVLEKSMKPEVGRIFYRCVDWNKYMIHIIDLAKSRIFYRCVDWNDLEESEDSDFSVASFTDAWIETYFRRREQYLKSRIFYRCVDWNRAYEAIYNAYIRSHLLQMRGLKLWRGEHSNGYYVSHLLQMRGLKQGVVTNINIKTSRIFYRCVDWNSFLRSNWA